MHVLTTCMIDGRPLCMQCDHLSSVSLRCLASCSGGGIVDCEEHAAWCFRPISLQDRALHPAERALLCAVLPHLSVVSADPAAQRGWPINIYSNTLQLYISDCRFHNTQRIYCP